MYISHTNSTNTQVKEQYLDREDGFTLYTFDQRAGRGQAGNSWHAEAGKNLQFTMLLRNPRVDIEHAFALSMAVSRSIVDTIQRLTGISATVKWPNDIYIGDRKVCGILIETILSGSQISHAIVGVGLNINQTQWPDNLPNPISIYQACGIAQSDLHQWLAELQNDLNKWLATAYSNPQLLKQEYMSHLYRKTGVWPFIEREVNITPTAICQKQQPQQLMAEIQDVTNQGEIILMDTNGNQRTYHHKQIQFIIEI